MQATVSPGDFITSAVWNANVKALGDFLLSPPIFFAYQATAQTVPNAAFTPVPLDTEVFDTEGGHSTTTNTSRYTFQVAGTYRVDGLCSFASNATGFRGAKLNLNGSTAVIGSEQLSAAVGSFGTTATTSAYVAVNVGDYVEMSAYQSSGAGLLLASNASMDYVTSMRALWVSK